MYVTGSFLFSKKEDLRNWDFPFGFSEKFWSIGQGFGIN
jgi:hypothetical protein